MGEKYGEEEIKGFLERYPHLREYVEEKTKRYGFPEFYKTLTRDMGMEEKPNLVYRVYEDVFVHVYRDRETGDLVYAVIEPKLPEKYKRLYDRVLFVMTELAADTDLKKEGEKELKRLCAEAFKRLKVPKRLFEPVFYTMKKNIIGYGKLDAFFHDTYLEDVRNAGVEVYVVHKVYGNMITNVRFDSLEEVDRYVFDLGVRMNKRMSTTRPIVDGILPENNARVNIIYGEEVAKNGTSFAIRLVEKEPMSVIDLIHLGTMSPEIAAYLWIALENGMSVFVCGPAASGKTTTVRAITAFIRPDLKIYTVEDTPEMFLPHRNWQATMAKENRATMYDLLKASLRSRPNYIIVGEIRGKEGYVAFNAMQTGHPVISTFHGSSIQKVIQRLTGPPINVPMPFITNLNIVVIQRAFRRGGQIVRRVVSVHEIENYVEGKGVMTREVFKWNPQEDKHEFPGRYNSYILEKKIALFQGLEDRRKIYEELDFRAKVLEEMDKRGIRGYWDVWNVINRYVYFGKEGLPFPVEVE